MGGGKLGLSKGIPARLLEQSQLFPAHLLLRDLLVAVRLLFSHEFISFFLFDQAMLMTV
jgi:hypothetical protein